MRPPPLAKDDMRSASRPPASRGKRGHTSGKEVQLTTLSPRDPDHTTGSPSSTETPVSNTEELVTNTSKTPPSLTEDTDSLNLSPTSQPELTLSPRQSVASLNKSKATLEESVTGLPNKGSNPSESETALKELPASHPGSPSITIESATALKELSASRPGSPPSPSESTPAFKKLPASHPGLASNPSESESSLDNRTIAPDESPSRLEKLEESEIPSTPPSTNPAPPPPNSRPSIAPPSPDQRVRASKPPPEPILGQAKHTPVQPNGRPGRKRKRASAADELAGQPESNKKKKRKKDNRVDKRQYKTSRELGHDFVGFITLVDDHRALDIANKILELPVPQNVSKRLIYFCDASIRCLCAAAGIVWPRSLASSEWEGKGVFYPLSIDSSPTVELFAIACTLELAIREIDQQRATISQNSRVDRGFFQQHSSLTRSHVHGMTKEVFVFTDDINALRRIDGGLPYYSNDDMASHVEAITRHSKTLNQLGVHVELHLSPGHRRVPGNEAADAIAKKAQNELFVGTTISWPDMDKIKDKPLPSEMPQW
ncbi:hypothetical protein ACN42_g10520 [Penicillium freii]|uniref:Uncharacterized protein n=1 Tax=Penicillium freii TaxID=48697 RepID=A0A101M9W6_PENFR|nr:hypothetical protein ACN42_g10520 [Penicillium freii]